MTQKIKISSEITYLVAIILLSLAVAILSAANFGISMIVAPAYLLSLKTGFLSFGQAEYVIQACVFILLCIVLRKFKFAYLFSFGTCLIYGFVLDLWRKIPFLNPAVTPPDSIDLPLRILMFIIGMILTSFAVALFFKTYLFPQVYDFFVKAVSAKYGIKLAPPKNNCRPFLSYGKRDYDVCVLRRNQRHWLGHACYGAFKRHRNRLFLKTA